MIEKIENDFKSFRASIKECPVCSDLWHGFREGCLHRQTEIEKLTKENAQLRECVEFYIDNKEKLRLEDENKKLKRCLNDSYWLEK